MKFTFSFLIFLITFNLSAQELNLFQVWPYETNTKETLVFVSLSEIYPMSNHSDSSAIPTIDKNANKEDFETLVLEGKYRTNFLSRTGIKETDYLYLYNFAKNELKMFQVKNLNVVACLTVYGADFPYSEHYYHIGFEIYPKNAKETTDDFANTLVCVGKENPFYQAKLTNIVWKEIDEKKFSSNFIQIKNTEYVEFGMYTIGKCYQFESAGFSYFTQELITEYEGKNMIFGKRLIVVNQKTQKKVIEKLFYESEGTSLVPMEYQWTGKLFKNKPPVVFGFQYESFDCEKITFLDAESDDLYLKCDNRH